jgi:uncharacterized protein YnzC (UPF0291/DUF896 family)
MQFFKRLAHKNEAVEQGALRKMYAALVNEKIRARYDISEELAILRQRDTNPEKFNEYNEFAERCKAEAATEVGI